MAKFSTPSKEVVAGASAADAADTPRSKSTGKPLPASHLGKSDPKQIDLERKMVLTDKQWERSATDENNDAKQRRAHNDKARSLQGKDKTAAKPAAKPASVPPRRK